MSKIRFFGGLFTLVLILLSGLSHSFAERSKVLEARVQAAYLYNFTKFITWPEKDAPATAKRHHICYLGQGLINTELDRLPTLDLPTVIRIKKLSLKSTIKEFDFCHIIYLNRSVKTKFSSLIPKIVSRSGILIVSDIQDQGMINFITKDDLVRFTVNLALAEKAGFKISSRLLAISAKVIR